MTLPKIQYPTTNFTIPSTKKTVKVRPFLVSEEKILLIAKESKDNAEILGAIKQVVQNCIVDKTDTNKLTISDLEYLFVKLRSISVDTIVSISYIDDEDEKRYDFEVDLSKVEVKFPEKINPTISITDNMGLIMKYPSASFYSDKDLLASGENYIFELIIRCLDKVYEGDNIYEAKNYSHKDINDFILTLDTKTFEKIRTFLTNLPRLSHTIKYTNSLGKEKVIELNSLSDFFIW